MINLGNYEEYFILYMDNELSAEQKLLVEKFISSHPHLADELEVLMNTRLPVDEVSFHGKDDLLASAMKATIVDESLLLYIDNELTASDKAAVEDKIKADENYALQHTALMQTKLDSSEKILHPNKKELYRHTERVISFKVWMRVAAAVILLLLSSLYFLADKPQTTTGTAPVASSNTSQKPGVIVQPSKTTAPLSDPAAGKQDEALLVSTEPKQNKKSVTKVAVTDNSATQHLNNTPEDIAYETPEKREITRFDVNRFATEPQIKDAAIVNNTIAYTSVTSSSVNRKTDDDPLETAVTDGDFKDKKKTPAKGFFRKVSRFIERNTGIGTVNADNELLIGAVALKLK